MGKAARSNSKKWLCLVLALVFLVSAVPAMAFAGEAEAIEPEASPEATELESEVEVTIYDPQPATLEDVQAAIDAADNARADALALGATALEALSAWISARPHWQYEVAAELMPEGYNCQLVDWDEIFLAEYYTFFVSPVVFAAGFGDGEFVIKPPEGLDDIRTAFPTFVGNTRVDMQYTNVAIATLDKKNQFGAMWAEEKLDLSMPFSTKMELHLGHSASPADTRAVADGMTFTMHNHAPALTQMIGGRGEGLGVWTGRNSSDQLDGSYLPHSLVIEFDTYINEGQSSTVRDPVSDSSVDYAHCALIYPRANDRTKPILPSDHKNTYYFKPTQNWIPFTVKWEPEYADDGTLGGTLTYNFNNVEQIEEIDDVVSVFNGTKAWWGFTGATGAQTAVQAAAITKLPSPQYNMDAVKSVENENEEDLDGGYAYAGDTLTYTIRATGSMTDGGTRIGPIKIMDKLPEYVAYAGGDVTVTMSDGSTPFNVTPVLDQGTLTVNTGCYLRTSGDWLEITFDVKVKGDTDAGTVVENTATVEAGNLEDSAVSNTTSVTIMEDAKKTVASGSAGYNQGTVTIGDEVTYKITYFNSSGSMADLTITDPLPEGVVYIEDSATNEGIYDPIQHQIVWNLYDIETGTGGSVEFTVGITKDIDRGEKLVNKAELEWSDGKKEEPDTENPVAGYKVIYHGNGGDIKPNGDTEHTAGLFPTGSDYTVLGNDEVGFTWNGYTFLGWNTKSDGSGDGCGGGDMFYAVTSDITLYAQWGRDLVFRKIDAESVGGGSITALTGARFELYRCSHIHDTACDGLADPGTCSHTHTPLEETATCWGLSSYTAAYGASDDSIVTFTGLTDGTCLLMETTAPDGYRLPGGQWIIEAEGGLIAFTGISGDPNIPAVVEKANFDGKEDDSSVEFWICNISQYELPVAGYGGTFWFTMLGGLLLTAGLLMGIRYYRRKPGNRSENKGV